MSEHVPVLAHECLDILAVSTGMTIVDGTLGGGGHAQALAARVGPSGRVIALDRDPKAVETSRGRLPANVTVLHANYADVETVLRALDVSRVDGMLLDLGLSSDQLADDERGFSYHSPGPLDLRFDPTSGEPAWKMLERLTERELADLIYQFGEERASRAIARRICETRNHVPIRTAQQLAALVRSCVRRSKHHAIDPATRTFQALRIAVNRELDLLTEALRSIPRCLKPGGRLAVISFHSLEDRLVKQALRDRQIWEVITKTPIRPTAFERAANPRSRAAKLRAAALRQDSP